MPLTVWVSEPWFSPHLGIVVGDAEQQVDLAAPPTWTAWLWWRVPGDTTRSHSIGGMRRWGRGLGWAWFTIALAAFALRWVDTTGPVPTVQALLPVAGLSLLALVALAALAREWVLAFTAALLVVPYAVLALPWWVGGPAEHQDQDIVVLTVNLLYGRADLGQVEQAARDLRVDALVLVEVTPEAMERLESGLLPELLPHRSGSVRTDAGGTLVLTADPHTPMPDAPSGRFDSVPVRVDSPSGTWVLLGAHTHPPSGWDSSAWRQDLTFLDGWVHRRSADEPLVIAGDLNSSHGHPAFRQATASLESTHQRVGAGWVRTWPAGGLVPAFVQIDHVLARGFTVVDAGHLVIEGSDHRAVWGRVRLAGLP